MEPQKTVETDEQPELVEHGSEHINEGEPTTNGESPPAETAQEPDLAPQASIRTRQGDKYEKKGSPRADDTPDTSIFFLRVGATLFDAMIVGLLAIVWLYISTSLWQITLSGRAGIPWLPQYAFSLVSPYSVTYTWMIGVGSALWPIASPLVGLAAAVSSPDLKLMNPEAFYIALVNVCLAPVIVDTLYRVLMERSRLQGTLGKRLLGIQVTDAAGNKLSISRAIWRYAARVLSLAPFWIGISFAFFNKSRQVIHDRMSGTKVGSTLPAAAVRRRTPWAFLVCGLFFAFIINICVPAVLSSLSRITPQDSATFYAELVKADNMVRNERWETAVGVLAQLVQEHPDNLQAHVLLSLAYRGVQNYPQAIDEANRALEIDPYCAPALCARAASLEAQGKTEEALKDYTAASILNPRNTESHLRRANLLNKQGMYNEAYKEAMEAVSSDAGNVDAQSILGTSLAKLKRWDEAITAHQAAFSQSTGKKRREFLKQLGICQYAAGRYRDAQKSFSLGFKLEPKGESALRAENLRWVAECELMLKDWTAARSAIASAVKLDPNNANLYYLSSCISYLNNDTVIARLQANQALAKGLNGPDGETQKEILAAILQPDAKEAYNQFTDALKRSPGMRELALLHAQAAKHTGN